MRRLLVIAVLALATWAAHAQVRPAWYDFARPGLDWYTIETEHARVHFHAEGDGTGSSRTAQVVARIVEDIWNPITELYGHEPDAPVSFVLKDFEDYSNGAAYFFDNIVEIWAPALETPFRGDHAWLRNVITHEFTHLVQVQKTMKASRHMPFLYLQYLDYENVRRPDVLYGFPNVLVTYPIPVLNNPAWLAEGTAQWQRADLDYDRWDSHRDMLLRTQVLAGQALSLEDMGGFYSHTSLGRESVYNHGFAFSQYIAATRGEQALADLSDALSRWKNVRFEGAAADALGIDGRALYDEWMGRLTEAYRAGTATIRANEVGGSTVFDEGFFNLNPRVSPDGSRLAWISNAGEDFSRLTLHVADRADDGGVASRIDIDAGRAVGGYTCAFGHRLVPAVSGAFSWSPDGKRILFARITDMSDGHLVSDLWEVDVKTREKRRVTNGARAADPAHMPDGTGIVYATQADGTSNLVLLDRGTGESGPLTTYEAGEQVTEPRVSPDGRWVYFGLTSRRGRDIWRVPVTGGTPEPVVATEHDERSPALDAGGGVLYYASDAAGIYDIYRTAINAPSTEPERLTRVVGGAFMPEPAPGGSLYFARYEAEGYRIAHLDAASLASLGSSEPYRPPGFLLKQAAPEASGMAVLNTFDDSDLAPVHARDMPALRDSFLVMPGLVRGGDPARAAPYTPTFTSFSFLPVLRMDRYVSRRRSRTDVRLPDRSLGETLARNAKVGVYVGSREVLPGLSMFGGLMVAPASRSADSAFDFLAPSNLLKLERDMFLQFEYARGVGPFSGRWAPQVSLELFNVRRNVENGLSIEEFPCTACYPDTTLADLSYNLWQVDFALRSKVTRALLVEVGVRYSPYRVTTERFFSKELAQSIPESSSRYFIGRAFRVKAYYEAMKPHRHADVVPEGIRAEVSLEREVGRLLTRFDVEDGLLAPVYERDVINRVTADVRIGTRLFRSQGGFPFGVDLRTRASTVLGGAVDDFYNDYTGGLTGARGYPFYALGGNKTLWVQAAYTMPLLPDIRRQLLFLYIDKVYARVYGDATATWSGSWSDGGGFRKDVGAELRFGLGSFYLLPTAFFVSATYGMDAFDFRLDEDFVTPDGRTTVRYGKSLQWHVGVLFGFDQL